MANLRDTITDAGSEEESYGNYDYAFGAPSNDEYASSNPDTGASLAFDSGESRASNVLGTTTGSYAQGGGTGMDWASGLKASAQQNTAWNPERGGIRMTGSPAGSGGGGAASYGTATIRKTVLPEGEAWPTFQGPKWDEQAIRAKARKVTAPLIAEMGMKVQQAMSRYYENPNVRRMVLRDTLAGYGIGIGRAIAQGESAARSEYGAEYGREWNEAMTNYNMAKEKLLANSQQVTTTTPVSSRQQFEDLTGETYKGKKVQYGLSGRGYTTSM